MINKIQVYYRLNNIKTESIYQLFYKHVKIIKKLIDALLNVSNVLCTD